MKDWEFQLGSSTASTTAHLLDLPLASVLEFASALAPAHLLDLTLASVLECALALVLGVL